MHLNTTSILMAVCVCFSLDTHKKHVKIEIYSPQTRLNLMISTQCRIQAYANTHYIGQKIHPETDRENDESPLIVTFMCVTRIF